MFEQCVQTVKRALNWRGSHSACDILQLDMAPRISDNDLSAAAWA
jgi:hypothetical protein